MQTGPRSIWLGSVYALPTGGQKGVLLCLCARLRLGVSAPAASGGHDASSMGRTAQIPIEQGRQVGAPGFGNNCSSPLPTPSKHCCPQGKERAGACTQHYKSTSWRGRRGHRRRCQRPPGYPCRWPSRRKSRRSGQTWPCGHSSSQRPASGRSGRRPG